MPRRLQEVEEEALELEIDDRAALAQALLHSLEGLSESENEGLWIAESERRREQLESRQAEALPGDEVLRRAAAEIS